MASRETEDRSDEIRRQVAGAYATALARAEAREGACCCAPSGGVAAGLAGYGEERASQPEAVSFGCGNPLAFAGVEAGQTVVDLGSGAGLDLILAARRVGPRGIVIGVDMTDAMIEKARENVRRAGLSNIEVRKGLIEELPIDSESVDWVLSNCVINLSPEKPRVFAEIARVLRPGGSFRISDIVVEELPDWLRSSAAAYAACVAGAIPEARYLEGLAAAGLAELRVDHRQVYSAAQLRALVESDLESYGLDPALLGRSFEEIEGKVWSAYFSGRRPGTSYPQGG